MKITLIVEVTIHTLLNVRPDSMYLISKQLQSLQRPHE